MLVAIDKENRLKSALENLKDENIKRILQEVSKLNNVLKKRNDELVFNSTISSEIISQVKNVKDKNENILNYIDDEVIEDEMKRRHIEDKKFDDELEGFISTGVLQLLSSLYDQKSDIS